VTHTVRLLAIRTRLTTGTLPMLFLAHHASVGTTIRQ